MPSQIGLIGIGLMGENLALNMADKGFSVSVFDLSPGKVERFVSGRGQGKKILGCQSVPELIASLALPRKIMLMVPAGKPVDEIIETLMPLLERGDIIIDGGNSHFSDTTRRTRMLEGKGLLYVGAGVSGGEEGALLGPSIMPGGSVAAWKSVGPIFQAIAAKVDGGVPCCDWIGAEGSGHFVKMVHNGIEYGDMQLICEVYDVMRNLLGMSAAEMHQVFKVWSEGELKSYLIEITRDILAVKDEDGLPLLDKILDKAGQKGTGKWTVVTALDVAAPLTLITESVFARVLSSMKDERVLAATVLTGPQARFGGDRRTFIDDLGKALYAAKIISYTQGYQLLRAAAQEFGWKLNYGGIALMWRGGCIIRSVFLGKIGEAFDANPELVNLLLDPFFRETIGLAQQSLRNVLAEALKNGIPTPAMSSALAYYDGYRSAKLPANLLQAQRDYFGAHQYERVDQPRGMYFHTNWTGRGGATASTVYSA
ncbi:MAG: decarboxylating NADP(+)-dependent phosphogluconate dehydrogenase [Rhodoferax sp.]|uniref:decarboxylating NADP(+)-dependent phosphogluconate dehydrogenase n=1 Tax=Rhodoferax sp. TaxID=50421 RepID=UPI0026050253|nr:decarboxylating NADP(+)-dependent phosphogluconate dehydrogenase [Rhodoferax sp.]MDD5333896.1 decarboxylating NADP(+)-dependent phosphogluconate dehydrogenase [Rhodoferax sp.]